MSAESQLDFRTHMPFTSWSEDALETIRLFAPGKTLTADSMRLLLGSPERPNEMGAVFRTAKRQGMIRMVAYLPSTQPTRHGGMVRLWERT